jgi:peptidoglycan hydrolase CwlO-like protein
MSFNINLLAYIIVYLLSIVFLILIFIRLKNNLLINLQNLLKIKNQEVYKLVNEFNNNIIAQLKTTKKEFETTQEIQKNVITELQSINQFLKEIPQKIEKLNSSVVQRTEFEHEIIRLKKIIKRRDKNV